MPLPRSPSLPFPSLLFSLPLSLGTLTPTITGKALDPTHVLDHTHLCLRRFASERDIGSFFSNLGSDIENLPSEIAGGVSSVGSSIASGVEAAWNQEQGPRIASTIGNGLKHVFGFRTRSEHALTERDFLSFFQNLGSDIENLPSEISSGASSVGSSIEAAWNNAQGPRIATRS